MRLTGTFGGGGRPKLGVDVNRACLLLRRRTNSHLADILIDGLAGSYGTARNCRLARGNWASRVTNNIWLCRRVGRPITGGMRGSTMRQDYRLTVRGRRVVRGEGWGWRGGQLKIFGLLELRIDVNIVWFGTKIWVDVRFRYGTCNALNEVFMPLKYCGIRYAIKIPKSVDYRYKIGKYSLIVGKKMISTFKTVRAAHFTNFSF